MIGIYIITNLITGETYIGQSIDIQRRFHDHRCISHESNRHLRYALKKYGKENFKYEILEECAESELDEKERYYIKKLKPEYNVATGGQDSLRRYPDEIKAKISEKAKEQWANMSDEEKRARIKNNLKGPAKGHAVSEETRQKIREKITGKKQSPETIKKRRETLEKKKLNGYVRTNDANKKKIVCVETGCIYESVKAAAESIRVTPSSVSAMLKGRQKSVKGLHFEYLKV